jgi:hypothetical protein
VRKGLPNSPDVDFSLDASAMTFDIDDGDSDARAVLPVEEPDHPFWNRTS